MMIPLFLLFWERPLYHGGSWGGFGRHGNPFYVSGGDFEGRNEHALL